MATNPPISSPNITVYEVQKTQTPVIAAPVLNSFITGPAKEIVKVISMTDDEIEAYQLQLPKRNLFLRYHYP